MMDENLCAKTNSEVVVVVFDNNNKDDKEGIDNEENGIFNGADIDGSNCEPQLQNGLGDDDANNNNFVEAREVCGTKMDGENGGSLGYFRSSSTATTARAPSATEFFLLSDPLGVNRTSSVISLENCAVDDIVVDDDDQQGSMSAPSSAGIDGVLSEKVESWVDGRDDFLERPREVDQSVEEDTEEEEDDDEEDEEHIYENEENEMANDAVELLCSEEHDTDEFFVTVGGNEHAVFPPFCYEEIRRSRAVLGDDNVDILVFPEDDIEVETQLIGRDLDGNGLTEKETLKLLQLDRVISTVDPYIADCAHVFFGERKVVKRKYWMYNGIPCPDTQDGWSSACNHEPPDPVLSDHSEAGRRSRRLWIAKQRFAEIFPWLWAPVGFDWGLGLGRKLCDRREQPVWRQEEHRVVIQCDSLSFSLPQFEPYFCSLSLYDARRKKKITENFSFDLNSEDALCQILGPCHLPAIDPMTRCKHAIFSITNPNPYIFLCLQVEVVLHSVPGDAIKPFLNPKSYTKKDNQQKLAKEVAECCLRNGCYRQPLLWGAAPLYRMHEDTAELVLNTGRQCITKFTKITSDIREPFDISEWIKETKSKSDKVLGCMEMQVHEYEDWMRSNDKVVLVLDPANNPADRLRPCRAIRCPTVSRTAVVSEVQFSEIQTDRYPMEDGSSGSNGIMCHPSTTPTSSSYYGSSYNNNSCAQPEIERSNSVSSNTSNGGDWTPRKFEMPLIVRQVQEMPLAQAVVPFTSYIHTLYIYPEAMNLVNRMWSPNVCVKVALYKDDMIQEVSVSNGAELPDGECVFYSSSSSPSTLVSFKMSQVSYSCRTPQFHDEFKMRLPHRFLPKHHLLFTVYNIQLNKKKTKPEVLGYGIQMLHQEGKIVSGDHILPLYTKLRPGYTDPAVRNALPVYDNGDGIFEFRALAFSTLNPQDPALLKFFKLCKSVPNDLVHGNLANGGADVIKPVLEGIRSLRQMMADAMTQYLPIYCNELLKLMAALYSSTRSSFFLESADNNNFNNGNNNNNSNNTRVSRARGSQSSIDSIFESYVWNDAVIEVFETFTFLLGSLRSHQTVLSTRGGGTGSIGSSTNMYSNSNTPLGGQSNGSSLISPSLMAGNKTRPQSLRGTTTMSMSMAMSSSSASSTMAGSNIGGGCTPTAAAGNAMVSPRDPNANNSNGNGCFVSGSSSSSNLEPLLSPCHHNCSLRGSMHVQPARRSGPVGMYIYHLFDNLQDSFDNIHESIVHCWLQALEHRKTNFTATIKAVTTSNSNDVLGPLSTSDRPTTTMSNAAANLGGSSSNNGNAPNGNGTLSPSSNTSSASSSSCNILKDLPPLVLQALAYVGAVDDAWFFFDLIIKSLSLKFAEMRKNQQEVRRSRIYGNENNDNNNNDNDNNNNNNINEKDEGDGDCHVLSLECSSTFLVLLQQLCVSLMEAVCTLHKATTLISAADGERMLALASNLNCDIALFIRDLLPLVDKDTVMFVLHRMLRMLWTEDIVLFAHLRLDMMKILCDYEHYIPLNLPLPLTHDEISTIYALNPLKLTRKHFLAGVMLQQVHDLLMCENKEVHIMAVTMLYELFSKHDHDVRYQSPEKRCRIATMYFPLIPIAISLNWAKLGDFLVEPHLQSLLACTVFVLNNVKPEFLRSWWSHQNHHTLFSFLRLLKKIALVFYPDAAAGLPGPCTAHNATSIRDSPSQQHSQALQAQLQQLQQQQQQQQQDEGVLGTSLSSQTLSTSLEDSSIHMSRVSESSSLGGGAIAMLRRNLSTRSIRKPSAILSKTALEEAKEKFERDKEVEEEIKKKQNAKQRLSHTVSVMLVSILQDFVEDLKLRPLEEFMTATASMVEASISVVKAVNTGEGGEVEGSNSNGDGGLKDDVPVSPTTSAAAAAASSSTTTTTTNNNNNNTTKKKKKKRRTVASEIWNLLVLLLGRAVRQEKDGVSIVHSYTMRMVLPCLFDAMRCVIGTVPPCLPKWKQLLYFTILCDSCSDPVISPAANQFLTDFVQPWTSQSRDSIDHLGRFDDPDEKSLVVATESDEQGQCKTTVMCGTAAKLVERLTHPVQHDLGYVNDFFITFQTFMTPCQLMKLLIRRWDVGAVGQGASTGDDRVVRIRVATSMTHWMDKHFYDFDEWNLSSLLDFVRTKMTSYPATQEKVLKTLLKKIRLECCANDIYFERMCNVAAIAVPSVSFVPGTPRDSNISSNSSSNSSINNINSSSNPNFALSTSLSSLGGSSMSSLPNIETSTHGGMLASGASNTNGNNNNNNNNAGWPLLQMFSFTNIVMEEEAKEIITADESFREFSRFPQKWSLDTADPSLLARNLTLLEFELFSKIESREFLDTKWMKDNRKELAPNIVAMTSRFNEVSMWVATSILQRETAKERYKLIGKFIEVATKCREMNNYNGVFEILSGLNNSAIHRLKKSLEKTQMKQFNDLLQLADTNENFRNLREALLKTNPPCIPYLGVFQTYLAFIEDGNPDIDSTTGLINFAKRRLVSSIISRLQVWQQKPYPTSNTIPEIRDALLHLDTMTNDELFKLSLLREPRQPANT